MKILIDCRLWWVRRIVVIGIIQLVSWKMEGVTQIVTFQIEIRGEGGCH